MTENKQVEKPEVVVSVPATKVKETKKAETLVEIVTKETFKVMYGD